MGKRGFFGLLIMAVAFACVCQCAMSAGPEDDNIKSKNINGKRVCTNGWECQEFSEYCCNRTISQIFQVYQFEDLFPNRNSPVAHAVQFWNYDSFIKASTLYQPLGFGTTGGKLMQMKEIAAFLGHVGAKTTCGYGVAAGGPLAWGLCYNKEMSPQQDYCDEYFNYEYPCAPGALYYGRGAIPVYWNYNYGKLGECLKIDLLQRPDYLETNATIAFSAAMSMWMNPVKKGQPSPHEVFVGKWKPTKNDTMEKRVCGFGTTMNIMYGDSVCGQGNIDPMNVIISHYLHYLDLMGVGREEGGANEVLTCAEQICFNPSFKKSSS